MHWIIQLILVHVVLPLFKGWVNDYMKARKREAEHREKERESDAAIEKYLSAETSKEQKDAFKDYLKTSRKHRTA